MNQWPDSGVLGFVLERPQNRQPFGYWWVAVPLWFPTLLLSIASLLIWRKRPAQRLSQPRGFALEPGADAKG